LTTCTLDTKVLECFCTCLDEGAEERRKEDEDVWGWKRRKGDTQSFGTWEVKVAQKMRKQQRYATNCVRRFMMPGWDIGAKGTISLLDRDSGELRPLSDFSREWVCCGNVMATASAAVESTI